MLNYPGPSDAQRAHQERVAALAGKYTGVEWSVEDWKDAIDSVAHLVGPCYLQHTFARLIGLSEAEVEHLTETRGVLALPTPDGTLVYPALQIHDRYVVSGLSGVLNTLSQGTENPFVWAMWLLCTPAWSIRPDEEPVPIIHSMIAGHRDEVLGAATHIASAWKGGPVTVTRW